jgi:hypothetical protein
LDVAFLERMVELQFLEAHIDDRCSAAGVAHG